MNLYKICREVDGHGEFQAMVIRAPNTEKARFLAAEKAGAEGKDAWLHIQQSTIVILGTTDDTNAAVICREAGRVLR